ncbi:MAG: peptide ABC transporter substrate-binding protein, partial [Burkholderiales bacterium]|nr:peptide ABC transporter substrate-binding protein [Burkholderiales bacterium]
LIDIDQSDKPIPGMAKRWEISPDGKTYTFYLRDDLKFSDGSPITAESFVYSWRRLANPKTGAYTFVIDHLKNAKEIFAAKLPPEQLGITAIESNILQVTLDTPDPAFIAKCTAVFTTPVPQHTIEQYGESWAIPEHLVSAGAYKIVDRIVNGPIKLTKNNSYYASNLVQINNLEFIPYPDRNAAISAYKAGNIDISANVPVDQYQELKQKYPDELKTVKMEGITFYSLNTQVKSLQNKNLRQALSMAIDREIIAHKVLANGQVPLYSYTTNTIENSRYHNLDYAWSKLPRNEQIKLAQNLYNKAGYNSKKPFKVDLLYDNNDANRKVAVAIADMWKTNLGVKANLHSSEWKTYLEARKTGKFEIIKNSWGAAFNFVTTYTPEYACGNAVNVSKLCTNGYDKLLELANEEQNRELQTNIYGKALSLAMNEYGIIPLYQNSYTMLIKPYVHGLDVENNLLNDIRSKWISFK